jgi:predicted ATPase
LRRGWRIAASSQREETRREGMNQRSRIRTGQIPRIQSLRVENYRALRRVELDDLRPLTVLMGPNGSGKSTVFDVFNFLSECFQYGLRHAWDRRGRGRELKTRGATGPIVFELKYKENQDAPRITYHLAIDEGARGPEVVEEWLQWRRGSTGKPFRFLEFQRGMGRAVSGELPDAEEQRKETPLRSPDLIAVNTLGQLAEHPRVAALRDFITDWYVSYLSIDQTRSQPEAGPQRRGEGLGSVGWGCFFLTRRREAAKEGEQKGKRAGQSPDNLN